MSASHKTPMSWLPNVPDSEFPTLIVNIEFWQLFGKSQRRNIPGRKTLGEDVPREKPSWRAITSRASTAQPNSHWTDNWRPAQLHLEESEHTRLKVLGEGNVMHCAIDVNQLTFNDIRQVDRSIAAGKKYTLALYCSKGLGFYEPQMSKHKQPIFLSFPSKELLSSWVVLLRSHAKNESLSLQKDKLLYRVSRSIEFELIQATIFGTSKDPTTSDQDNRNGESSSDARVYCEILVNSQYAGITISQNCDHKNFHWHQTFAFNDLDEVSSLQVNLMKERKGENPMLAGSASLHIRDWRRGIIHSGHIPICRDQGVLEGHRLAVGEMKYKCKVEENIIFPERHYRGLSKMLGSGDTFTVLHDAEIAFRVSGIFEPMVAISMARGVLENEVESQANREVNDPNTTHNALFRGTSILSRIVVQAMKEYGQDWLEASLGAPIREICEGRVVIDKASDHRSKGTKEQEQQIKILTEWCDRVWGSIWQAREDCPPQLRLIFHHIKTSVRRKFGSTHPNLHWQVISAFVFLRFFVAAIIDPQLWGLWPGVPPSPVQHSLKLVGRVIQSLANLNQKEASVKLLADFMEDNLPAMRDFLTLVSTTKPDEAPMARYPKSRDMAQDSRLQIMQSIHRQCSSLSELAREAVTPTPHLIDVPRQFAIIASRIADNCQKLDPVSFTKRGIEINPQSLKRLAALVWHVLLLREDTLHTIVDSRS